MAQISINFMRMRLKLITGEVFRDDLRAVESFESRLKDDAAWWRDFYLD